MRQGDIKVSELQIPKTPKKNGDKKKKKIK